MRKLCIALAITIAVGCQSQTDKTNAEGFDSTSTNTGNDDVKPDDAFADIAGCYMQVLQKDTFAASIQQQGNTITGRLSFDNYEKDGSTGTVTGDLRGDVLKLDYVFASEGMNSVMEVYFKYRDGLLIRGIGEMKTKGDTAYFINPALIQYNGSELIKIPCQNLPVKYK